MSSEMGNAPTPLTLLGESTPSKMGIKYFAIHFPLDWKIFGKTAN